MRKFGSERALKLLQFLWPYKNKTSAQPASTQSIIPSSSSTLVNYHLFDRRFLPFWQSSRHQLSILSTGDALSAGHKEVSPTSSHKENSSSLLNQLANLPGFNPLKARIVKQYAKTPEEILPTAVEKSLPWRRDRSTYNFGMCLLTRLSGSPLEIICIR